MMKKEKSGTPTIRITTFPVFILRKSLDKFFKAEINHRQNQYSDDCVLKDE